MSTDIYMRPIAGSAEETKTDTDEISDYGRDWRHRQLHGSPITRKESRCVLPIGRRAVFNFQHFRRMTQRELIFRAATCGWPRPAAVSPNNGGEPCRTVTREIRRIRIRSTR